MKLAYALCLAPLIAVAVVANHAQADCMGKYEEILGHVSNLDDSGFGSGMAGAGLTVAVVGGAAMSNPVIAGAGVLTSGAGVSTRAATTAERNAIEEAYVLLQQARIGAGFELNRVALELNLSSSKTAEIINQLNDTNQICTPSKAFFKDSIVALIKSKQLN